MLALVYISQIVPYFSLFWQFYGWHNTKSKQAPAHRRRHTLVTLHTSNCKWGVSGRWTLFILIKYLKCTKHQDHTVADGFINLHSSMDTDRDQTHKMAAPVRASLVTCNHLIYIVSVQFLNIITLKWLDCVIIRVAERQAKYDHYSCYYFLWSSRTMVVMINEASQHSSGTLSLSHSTARSFARLGRTLTTVNNNKVNCKISNEEKSQLQRFSAIKDSKRIWKLIMTRKKFVRTLIFRFSKLCSLTAEVWRKVIWWLECYYGI